MGFLFSAKTAGVDMTQIPKRLRLSLDSIAVWTAFALALVVRLGWIKHVPW